MSSYSVPIDRSNPGVIMLLLDHSLSMADKCGAGDESKAEALARAVNRLIRNLVLQCENGDQIRDYYDLGIIGYGGDGVGSAFCGALAGHQLIPISAVANYPLGFEVESMPDRPDLTLERPVWVQPTANGGTPMNGAIDLAGAVLAQWANSHRNSFPPLVLNVTDGFSTDGDPGPMAQQLRNIVTLDGNLLLFNIHISETAAAAIEYPASPIGLPDKEAEQLFEMSSELTPYMRTVGRNMNLEMADGCRGFMFNANPAQLSLFLDVGTRVAVHVDH